MMFFIQDSVVRIRVQLPINRLPTATKDPKDPKKTVHPPVFRPK